MNSQVPVWMSFIIIFIYFTLIALVTVGFQRVLDRLQMPDRHRALLWSISLFLTAWLSMAIVLAAQGFFWTGPEETVPRVAYALIPFVLGCAWLFVSPTFRRVVAETPPQWLIGLQANRLLGGLFLLVYAQGQLQLPALMAIPAGIGDLLVGLAAPVVAYLFITKHRNARRIGVLWNIVGITDLVIAVTTGVLTSPGPLHFFALEAPNLLMSAYPFAIIPAFGVPVWVLLHFLSLSGLLQKGKRKDGTLSDPKVVLVTGVSSGIGRETAQFLVERGFRVFGTARDPRRVEAIAGVEMIQLDVTDDASVAAAVQTVLQEAGQLDVLVNNAGYALEGALEETSLEEAREQFETNFFGVLRMVRAVLPTMRQQGYGRIVNISSVLGGIPAPFMGIYAASKHALEGYSETLDYEVRPFGLRVSLVEPGFTRTSLGAKGKNAGMVLDDYARQKKQVLASVERQIANGANPRSVAKAVHHALSADSPRLRYRVGGSARMVIALKWLLPEAAFHQVISRVFQVPQTVT